jgi:hypothetical protein
MSKAQESKAQESKAQESKVRELGRATFPRKN